MEQMLSRAKSKDHLLAQNNNIREKYMLMAGAQRVLQGGRDDKEKLVMDRYRRGEPDDVMPQSDADHLNPNIYQNRLKNAQNELLSLKHMPSSNSSRDPYQQYIPMSQHGQRRIEGAYQQ